MQGGQYLMARIILLGGWFDVTLSVNEDAGGEAYLERGLGLEKSTAFVFVWRKTEQVEAFWIQTINK